MNTKIVRNILSKMLLMESSFFILPIIISFYYGEPGHIRNAYYITIIALVVSYFVLGYKSDTSKKFYAKEGMITVALAWILMSFYGALPFYISGEIPSLIDAFFETSSGFTTTGASILTDVEAMSKSMLFWRSFTHLVGGMGILVFALAILPKTTDQTVHLMKAEVPGPSFGKLVSKASVNARILYKIYLAMTAVMILVLRLEGMSLFDAAVTSFGTAGTGGFGIKATSIAYYNSPLIEITIAVGMLLFGINFNLFYLILIGRAKDAFRSEELKWYLAIIGLASFLIFGNILSSYNNAMDCLRDSFFTVSSLITTTGYSTVDFGAWPVFSQVIMLILMFFGGMAGSTAGGFKISRVMILFKSAIREIRRSLNPKRVLTIRNDNKSVDQKTVTSVKDYFIIYILFFFSVLLLVSMQAPDFLSGFSAVMATFNNIGPGLGVVGPASSFASLGDFNKILLSFTMIAGRLEIFPILILLAPTTWKK